MSDEEDFDERVQASLKRFEEREAFEARVRQEAVIRELSQLKTPQPRRPECWPYVMYSLIGFFISLVMCIINPIVPSLGVFSVIAMVFFSLTTFMTLCLYFGIDF